MGDPFNNHGVVVVDHMDYGASLDASDYGAASLADDIGTLSDNLTMEEDSCCSVHMPRSLLWRTDSGFH